MRFHRSIAALLICALPASFTHAQEAATFSGGIKFGSFQPGISGIDSGTGFGFQFGYNATESVAIEFEYMSSSLDYDILGESGDFDVTTMGIYGAYRSTGKGYFLGKLGLINEKLKASSLNASESDSGLSLGIGGGFRASDSFSIEAEYTILEQDLNFIGLTGRFTF